MTTICQMKRPEMEQQASKLCVCDIDPNTTFIDCNQSLTPPPPRPKKREDWSTVCVVKL